MQKLNRRSSQANPDLVWTVFLLGLAFAVALTVPAARADIDVVPEVLIKGPDPGVGFESIGGVAMDPILEEFAVAEGGRGRILFFGLDGWLLGRAVHSVSTPDGDVRAGNPSSIAYDRQGNLLVVDRLVPYVDVLDYMGAFVARLELPGLGSSRDAGRGAVAVAVAPGGRILVGTQGDSARIHEFSPDYDYLGSWGVSGMEPGQLNGIAGIAVADDGRVLVACGRTKLGIQLFDSTGEFITGFGIHEPGPGNVSVPGSIAVTSDGRIWVADEMRHVVQAFSSAGEFLGFVGGGGIAAGEFQYPSALATDGRQRLIVAERMGGRVQVMRIR